jgi:hypothetical protein
VPRTGAAKPPNCLVRLRRPTCSPGHVMVVVPRLAAGRAASGTASEVVRSDVLSALYGHHVDVLRVHDRVIVVAGTGHDEHAVADGTGEGSGDGAVEIV